jgi:hypothetical protein
MLLRCYVAETGLDHVDERGFKMALLGALGAMTLLPSKSCENDQRRRRRRNKWITLR